MRFDCSLGKDEYIHVEEICHKIRIEMHCVENVIYLDQKDLSELIKYLKTLEEK